MAQLGDPLQLTASVRLANRIVATAHGGGDVQDGLPGAGDAPYWRGIAEGGAAMAIVGGTVVAPESTVRRGNFAEAWRPEIVPPCERARTRSRAPASCPCCSSCTWAAKRSAPSATTHPSRHRPFARRASRRRRAH